MAGQAGVAGWSTSGWILFCSFRRKVTGIDLKIRRDDSVIAVSFIVMMLMGGLALSLLAMVLRVMASGRKVGSRAEWQSTMLLAVLADHH